MSNLSSIATSNIQKHRTVGESSSYLMPNFSILANEQRVCICFNEVRISWWFTRQCEKETPFLHLLFTTVNQWFSHWFHVQRFSCNIKRAPYDHATFCIVFVFWFRNVPFPTLLQNYVKSIHHWIGTWFFCTRLNKSTHPLADCGAMNRWSVHLTVSAHKHTGVGWVTFQTDPDEISIHQSNSPSERILI